MMFDRIQKIRNYFSPFLPSLETEPIHFFILLAGSAVGFLALLYNTQVFSFPSDPPADFFYENYLWHSEAKEKLLYAVWIFLLPLISLSFWAGWALIFKKFFLEISHPRKNIFFSNLSILTALYTLIIVFVFLAATILKISSPHIIFLLSLLLLAAGYCAIPIFLKKNQPAFFFVDWSGIVLGVCLFFVVAIFSLLSLGWKFPALFFSPAVWHKVNELIFPIAHNLFFGILSGLAAVALFFVFRKQRKIHMPNMPLALEVMVVILTIFFLLYNPAYKQEFGYLSGGFVSHHYNDFLGSVNDILHGKVLMVDTFSQYGVLSMYALAAVFKYFLPFSYANLYAFLMSVTIAYYFLLYLFLRKFLGNRFFSFLGMVFIAFVNVLAVDTLYFRNNFSLEFYSWPGITPFRYFFDMPVFLLLVSYVRTPKKWHLYAISVLGAWALFHNMEKGAALIIAVFCFFMLKFLLPAQNLKEKALMLIKECATLIGAMLCLFLAIDAVTFLQSSKFPDWSSVFLFTSIFSSGYTASVMPVFGYYYVILAVYLLFVLMIIFQLFFNVLKRDFVVLGAITAYGIVTFFYYIVRSQPANIYQLTIPPAILFIFLFRLFAFRLSALAKDGIKNIFFKPSGSYVLFVFILLTAVIAAIGIYQINTVKRLIVKRYISPTLSGPVVSYRGTGFADAGIPPVYTEYRTLHGLIKYRNPSLQELIGAAELVRGIIPERNPVTMLSVYDTPILILADRVNSLSMYNIGYQVITRSQLYSLRNELIAQSPQYIFIDAERDGIEWPGTYHVRYLFDAVRSDYVLDKKAGFLELYINKKYLGS